MTERALTGQPERLGRGGGIRIDAEHLVQTVKGGVQVLADVSLTFRPGELVAIVGGSGAGKTTLLEALAGVRPATSGTVRFDGIDLYRNLKAFRGRMGYVPQDDIIHAELPLQRTLHHVARLRMPASTTTAERDAAVRAAMETLDLTVRADVRVGALSGGQRKRASIAVELITQPHVFFLDEPTSGLDPSTSAELLRVLRRLADNAATVVFTTHAVQDLERCDRIVFMAAGGHLAFTGSLTEAFEYFGVDSIEAIYTRLAEEAPSAWSERYRAHVDANDRPDDRPTAPTSMHEVDRLGPIGQWRVLTSRTFETIVHNRLTLAILIGAPAMVVAMMAVLFRPGAFAFADPSPTAIVMILFWISFGAFFFGLTYGMLQIVTERAILRREHLVGLDLGAQRPR